MMLYELFAAAGGAGYPPVAPEYAAAIREAVPPEQMAQVERVYQAIKQALDEAPADTLVETLGEQVRAILSRPN